MNTLRERSHEPEGECIFRVDRVIAEDDCLVWSFIVEEGRCQGSQLRHLSPLTKDHMWRLYTLLVGLGVEIPRGPFDFKPDEYVGLTVAGEVEEGRIVDFWPVKEAAKDEFIDRTQRAIDKARADLNDCLERYVPRPSRRV